ncbi:uncharacterized protein PHACADRAFT_248220 [Phanerochaete carnosa HHB-10118-sp]|uniref:Uncharacterized protein n=1 Tax=Phanerochaete carnosa (strain HHB-10118-sp) TaxID=650164 RepID=K5XEN3_PHACS|nr:uncharacterized protein PHACADRAFT_248220 [Phanerochaete carnosa HHB-10118-sp]EKM61542.1 hypothetical protein PHACADRAFT_248220 [Phanerochaete carnosa HHB-10118-sp]
MSPRRRICGDEKRATSGRATQEGSKDAKDETAAMEASDGKATRGSKGSPKARYSYDDRIYRHDRPAPIRVASLTPRDRLGCAPALAVRMGPEPRAHGAHTHRVVALPCTHLDGRGPCKTPCRPRPPLRCVPATSTTPPSSLGGRTRRAGLAGARWMSGQGCMGHACARISRGTNLRLGFCPTAERGRLNGTGCMATCGAATDRWD